MATSPDSKSVRVYIRDFLWAGNNANAHQGFIDVPYPFQEAGLSVPLKPEGPSFRWIHIPLNDTTFVKSCVEFYIGNEQANVLPDTWNHRVRPAITVPKAIIPRHARCMEPSFQVHTEDPSPEKQSSFTLFMPYLSWDKYENVKKRDAEVNGKKGDNADTANSTSGEDDLSSNGQHIRRTLDEFFYSGLRHTQARNAGQTVSKWTGKENMNDEDGRLEASPDSLVVMVDQLWIWVLEDGTLISCFPPVEFADPNFEDILASVIHDCEKCANPYDLTGLLVRCAIKNIFVEKNSQFADLIAIYRWAATNKVARHTELLEAFGDRQSSRGSRGTPAEGTEELKIALQITDILDELNILLLLLETQTEVLTSLHEGMYQFKPVQPKSRPNGGVDFVFTDTSLANIRVVQTRNTDARLTFSNSSISNLELSGKPDTMPGVETIEGKVGGFIHEAEQTLRLERLNLDRLRADASQAHNMVVELLDLEQKAASLEEARSTTKQGQAIMLFTVVTIIFLPLSFITSFLGQNVAEITGDEKNPRSSEVWRIAGPVSVVLIVLALCVAFFIMYPPSWPRARRRKEAV